MSLTDEQKNKLREWFTEQTKDLVFRQVHSVTAREEDVTDTEVTSINDKGLLDKTSHRGYLPAEESGLSAWEYTRCTIHNYARYFGFTKKVKLRKNDPCNGQSIFFNSSSCGFFDAPILKLGARAGKRPRVPIVRPFHDKDRGDIVAGFVEKGDKGWRYTQWFICSEAFLNLWTLVMYPDDGYETFIRGKKLTGDALKKVVLEGDYLISNPFKRWCDSLKDADVDICTPSNLETARGKVVALRYEKGAKEFYHLYPCLALMLVWGELPTDENIPNNPREKPVKTWDLPHGGWLEALLQEVAEFKF